MDWQIKTIRIQPMVLFIYVLLVSTISNVGAQAPLFFDYRAVIIDSSQQVVKSDTVGVQLSITSDTTQGMAIYSESHREVTDGNGIIRLKFGAGTVVTGVYDSIDWTAGPFFIKHEVDPYGGTNYVLSGINRLYSVPFVNYAASTVETDPIFSASAAAGIMSADTMNWNNKLDGNSAAAGITSADTMNWNNKLDSNSVAAGITSADTARWNNKQSQLIAGDNITISGDTIHATVEEEEITGSASTHYIGELYGGGMIFWLDDTGEHGFVVSMVDLHEAHVWSNVYDTVLDSACTIDGSFNTRQIINQPGHTKSAAKLCTDYTNADYGTGTFNDWYLPSVGEFILLNNELITVFQAFEEADIPDTTPPSGVYWTSTYLTELPSYDPNSTYEYEAFAFVFISGVSGNAGKGDTRIVRAIRAF